VNTFSQNELVVKASTMDLANNGDKNSEITAGKEPQHPMTPVPDAIRIGLRETAKILLATGRRRRQWSLTPWNPSQWMGLALAEDVIQAAPGYPPYRASIMDGYAVQFKEATTYILAGKSLTGQQSWGKAEEDNGSNTAIYVTTGAMVPDEYDTVIPVEDCRVQQLNDSPQLSVLSSFSRPAHGWIREAGSDIPAGTVVLPAGHVLDPVALGLLLQSGVSTMTVQSPVTVGVMSTGNELQPESGSVPDESIGLIPDVNRPMLLSLLASWSASDSICVNSVDLGMVRDEAKQDESTTDSIRQACRTCDVIITTGGISVGETDRIEAILTRLGNLHFGRLHMKPGKPTTLVTIPASGDVSPTLVWAMPGNPVSAYTCTQLLVRPCLYLLYHGMAAAPSHFDQHSTDEAVERVVAQAVVHTEISVRLAHDIKLDPERPEYHRVTLQPNSESDSSIRFIARSTGVQQSSRLLSIRDAEALLVLPQAHIQPRNISVAKAGEECFPCLLLQGFGSKSPFSRFCPSPPRVVNSIHMNSTKRASKQLRVNILNVTAASRKESLEFEDVTIRERVLKALSGSKSGSVVAPIPSRTFFYADGAQDKDGLCKAMSDAAGHELVGTGMIDLLVILFHQYPGSLAHHAELATMLRKQLSKVAESLALQARRGAGAQAPASVLTETVAGFLPLQGSADCPSQAPAGPTCCDGTIVIALPEEGLDEGLGNVRGLLKHALKVARGS
jgi:molybdopterin molybdotransferase